MTLSLQDFAHIAISTSAIIALFTFIASQWEKHSKLQKEEIRKWQSVLLYSTLDKHGELDFNSIKSLYLQNAQQIMSVKIPKKEIQDDALLRVLMDLIEKRMIYYTSEGTYCLDVAHPDNREEMNKTMFDLITQKEKLNQLLFSLRPKIFETLEKTKIDFNSDSLFRHLTGELGMEVTHEQYLAILLNMERQGAIARDKDGVLKAIKRVIK